MTLVPLAGAAWAIAAAAMTLLWAWSVRARTSGVARAVWPALAGGLALFYASQGAGPSARRAAIAWMMGSWGARLAIYRLYLTIVTLPETERGDSPFWNFQAHAVAAVVLSLPALTASMDAAPVFSSIELAAVGLWIVAFAGETTADRQRLRFEKNPANRGVTCRSGLWRYSRYADQWFRALVWVSFVLFGCGALARSVLEHWA